MAICKVINNHAKSSAALKNALAYILRNSATILTERNGPPERLIATENGSEIIGDVTVQNAYHDLMRIKREFGKTEGRQFYHFCLSWSPEEKKVTPREVLDLTREWCKEYLPEHQCVIAVHIDKAHVHAHVIANSVNFITGYKLQMKPADLDRAKEICNNLCRDRGWHVPEKGKHFDNTPSDDVTAWSKDQYRALEKAANHEADAWLAKIAIKVQDTLKVATGREDFIRRLSEVGVTVTWTDRRKSVTFEDEAHHKVRSTRLETVFHLKLDKEEMENEFIRNENRTRSNSIGAGNSIVRTRNEMPARKMPEVDRCEERDRDVAGNEQVALANMQLARAEYQHIELLRRVEAQRREREAKEKLQREGQRERNVEEYYPIMRRSSRGMER